MEDDARGVIRTSSGIEVSDMYDEPPAWESSGPPLLTFEGIRKTQGRIGDIILVPHHHSSLLNPRLVLLLQRPRTSMPSGARRALRNTNTNDESLGPKNMSSSSSLNPCGKGVKARGEEIRGGTQQNNDGRVTVMKLRHSVKQ